MAVRVGERTEDEVWFMETRGRVRDGIWFIKSQCLHLEADGTCSIYWMRPQACRDYEVDGEMCRATREAMG